MLSRLRRKVFIEIKKVFIENFIGSIYIGIYYKALSDAVVKLTKINEISNGFSDGPNEVSVVHQKSSLTLLY